MKSIKESFDAFHAKATQQGRAPITTSGAMQLGFYAGFVAAMKVGTDISHDASQIDTERAYGAMRLEMAAFFAEDNILSFYPRESKKVNGKVKA